MIPRVGTTPPRAGPPYIPHEKTPKKKENSVPDTRPVCVAPQSDPPSTCAGPVRRAVSGVPRVEPWLSSCRAVEAPSRHCRGAVEALCRGAVEALPVSSLSSYCRVPVEPVEPDSMRLGVLEFCLSRSVEVCRVQAVELCRASSNVELMNSCLAVEPGNAYAYSFA